MRRPHNRRLTAMRGPAEAPKNAIRKTNSPMVVPKIRNAESPVINPPTPVAKTATAARNGPVQPTPTATKPIPKK